MDNNFECAPLTLEELRGMDDQAVRVKNLEYEEGGVHTGVVTMGDPNDSDNGVYAGCVFSPILEYGKTWIAYAYPPAHIDREAWEPCGECAPNCLWCKHYQEVAKTIPDICRECKHYSNYEPEYKYCCECGRPLTEDAWAELEKRLRG